MKQTLRTSIWATRDVRIALPARAVSTADTALTTMAALLLLHDSGVGPVGVAALLVVMAVPTIATMGIAGRAADTLDSRTILVTCTVVQPAACQQGLAAVAGPLGGALGGVLFATGSVRWAFWGDGASATFGLGNATFGAVLTTRTPDAERGRVYAALGGLARTARLAALALGSVAGTLLGPRLTFVAGGVLGAVSRGRCPRCAIAILAKEQLDVRSETAPDDWLFPGLHPGRARDPQYLNRRLRPLGVTISALQNTARFRLAGAVPAKVLADMLSFSVATFENYARLAGGIRGDYPAIRARQP